MMPFLIVAKMSEILTYKTNDAQYTNQFTIAFRISPVACSLRSNASSLRKILIRYWLLNGKTVIHSPFHPLEYFIAGETTFYVSTYKGQFFKLSSQPSEHSLWTEEFRFTLEHPRGNANEVPHFIYSRESGRRSFVTSTLDLSVYRNFPIDIVVPSRAQDLQRETRKIYLIGRHSYGAMFSLNDLINLNCCRRNTIFSFYAFNVTEPGKKIHCANTFIMGTPYHRSEMSVLLRWNVYQ